MNKLRVAFITMLISTAVQANVYQTVGKGFDAIKYAWNIARRPLIVGGAAVSAAALIAGKAYVWEKSKDPKIQQLIKSQKFLTELLKHCYRSKIDEQSSWLRPGSWRKRRLIEVRFGPFTKAQHAFVPKLALKQTLRDDLQNAMQEHDQAVLNQRDNDLDLRQYVVLTIKACLDSVNKKLLPYDSAQGWSTLGLYGLILSGLFGINEYYGPRTLLLPPAVAQ